MTDSIAANMEVIGADGVHVGVVQSVGDGRIRLKKRDSHGVDEAASHYIELGFVAGVEGDKVRLSANADIAVSLEEDEAGRPVES
jgi:hypothetical protein